MTSLAYRHQTFGAFRSSKSPSLGDVHIPCHQLRGFPRFPFQDLTSSATEWNTHRRPVKRQYMALAITQSKAIQFPSYTLLPDLLPFLLPITFVQSSNFTFFTISSYFLTANTASTSSSGSVATNGAGSTTGSVEITSATGGSSASSTASATGSSSSSKGAADHLQLGVASAGILGLVAMAFAL